MKLLPVLILAATPVQAERMRFPPADEAGRDPSLLAFRDALLAHVAERDTEAVVAAACPDIHLGHGGSGGPEELRERLTLPPDTLAEEYRDQADDMREAYWVALEQTLAAPGYFDDMGEFWMPHQWRIRLPASVDPIHAYFVTGTRVALRDRADGDARILDQISHEVVLIADHDPQAEYQKVMLTDGTRGFMHRDYLWSMVGHRAALVKSDDGRWQLCTFVSGD
ncbi:SH3 domain-containing protein [Ruegeria sediminis]|uniref:SH3 domain-containing protein n=1 Tax=Ruegeria sediminis TaxID=2583820 RepID=A0ABY2X077_9RHOB|nr:SH3 domain-containing protein [Ruegeria sediminis]TMV08634.1 SH3 domain-containing protein [Ruegeria sediminis]